MNAILIVYALTILLFGFDSNSRHESTPISALGVSRIGWRTIADGVGLGMVSFKPWFRKLDEDNFEAALNFRSLNLPPEHGRIPSEL